MTSSQAHEGGHLPSEHVAALEVVPFAMLITDSSARALAVNHNWVALTGMSRAASLGTGWLSVLDPQTRGQLKEDALRVAAGGGSATGDYQLGAAESARWTRWWLSRHEVDGAVLVAIAVADVQEDHVLKDNLFYQATHDSLTGLVNRSYFLECTDQALRRSERHSRRVGVVFVDLDGFKQVNDSAGHSMGDRVLYAIASRLRHVVRNSDLVARIGGDEFAVLCEDLGAAEQAETVARRIASALDAAVELDGVSWSVAASVGAAVDHGAPDTAEDLVDRADRAMYAVKSTRKETISGSLLGQEGRVQGPQGSYPASAGSYAEVPGPEPGPPLRARLPAEAAPVAPSETPWSPTPPASQRQEAEPSRQTGRDPSQEVGGHPSSWPDPAVSDLISRAVAEQARLSSPGTQPRQSGPSPLPEDDPALEAARALLNEVVILRETLEGVRERLSRFAPEDPGVMDVTEQG